MSLVLPGAGAPIVADPIPQPDSVGLLFLHGTDQPAVLIVKVRLPAGIDFKSAGLLDRSNWAITGGVRRHPRIVGDPAPSSFDPGGPLDSVTISLDGPGDFSIYTLTLAGSLVDPYFASLKFRFHLGCAAPADCLPPMPQVEPPAETVAIDYLSKDFTGFRRALLEFIPTRLPSWVERSEADVGMGILELLAATGDELSYIQDRVANEAFISTATQRRSVEAHLSLIGYEMDAGASAYAWLHFQVSKPHLLRRGFAVRTASAGPSRDIVFETLTDRAFSPQRNELHIYDWGNPGACLTRASTSIALIGSVTDLAPGDWIVLLNLANGDRDAVRLTARPQVVPATPIIADPSRPLTLLTWSSATPLNHDYSVADTVVRGNVVVATHGATVPAEFRPAQSVQSINAVVVPPTGPPGTRFHVSAFGLGDPTAQITYTVLAPSGQKQDSQTVPQTVVNGRPSGGLADLVVQTADQAEEGIWTVNFDSAPPGEFHAVATWEVAIPRVEPALRPPRLRIPLLNGPLAFVDAKTLDLAGGTTSLQTAGRSVAQLSLTVDGRPWTLVRTLLDSGPADEVYRIESDESGFVTLVFGRGGVEPGGQGFGKQPDATSEFVIRYRVGGGTVGNVGQDTLTRPVNLDAADWFITVTNPLPALGGRDREPMERARRLGPNKVPSRLVAVTSDDYRLATEQLSDASGQRLVTRASAGFRWTGSWLTVSLAVEPSQAQDLDANLSSSIESFLDGRRLSGYDVQTSPAAYLPIQLELVVCVASGFTGTVVAQAVKEELSNGIVRGRPGFFHPVNFGFGDPIKLSRLYERVMDVTGVESVNVSVIAPLHSQDPAGVTAHAKQAGELRPGADQLIQLNADPDFPERGRLDLRIEGGL